MFGCFLIGSIVEHVGKGGADLGGDILLTGDGDRIIIQAKRSRRPVGNSFTRSARKLAAGTGVELYDRLDLKAWIEGSWPFATGRLRVLR